MQTIPHFIGGARVTGSSQRTAPVYNPATGEQTGSVVLGTGEDVQRAASAAKGAFPAWAETTPLHRARILNRFLRILEEHGPDLAAIITNEHGKILSDARGEVQRGIEVVEFAT